VLKTVCSKRRAVLNMKKICAVLKKKKMSNDDIEAKLHAVYTAIV
jgi:hypothetical protein